MVDRPSGRTRSAAAAYALAVATLVAAVGLRYVLDPWMRDSLPLVTIFGAVAAAVWLGGYRPAGVVVILGYIACSYLFIEPRGRLDLVDAGAVLGLLAYIFTSLLIVGFGEAARRAQRQANQRRELLRITLRSIGDAVITTTSRDASRT